MSTSTSRSSRTGGTKKSSTSSRSTKSGNSRSGRGLPAAPPAEQLGSPTPAAAGPAPEKSSRSRKEQPKPLRREIARWSACCWRFLPPLAISRLMRFLSPSSATCSGACSVTASGLRFMLLVSSGILMFHRGRPVRRRLISALLVPFLFGGLIHVLAAAGLWPGRQADSAALKSGLS